MDANSIVSLVESAAAAVAVARLTYLSLGRRFPALVAWLSILAATDFSLSLLPQRSQLYFWIYVGSAPAQCLFGIAAVRELLAVVFRDYPGIRSVGRFGVYAGVVAAGLISLLISRSFASDHSAQSLHLFYIEVAQRSIVFALALVIIGAMFALSRYPLRLSRNSTVSAVFFSSIFLSDAVRLLIDSLSSRLNNQVADITESSVIFLCLGTWTVLLQREAAAVEPMQVTFPNPAEAELLGELEALNRLLTRAARN